MSLPVVVQPEAENDLSEAFDWYESRKSGLGATVVAAVESVFRKIGLNPFRYAIARSDVRKAVVGKFPYCVFYRPHDDRVEVIAVFHTSRDPSVWEDRI